MDFNNHSRKINSMLASGAGLINQIVQLLGNFVYRTIFLMILSREYLGTSIMYHMYSAFAKQDTEKIGQLLRFYRQVYSAIAVLVLVLGAAFYPFLDTIVNLEELPKDISLPAVYFLFVFNSVASYLFVYKRSLLTADQREFKVVLFDAGVTLLGYVVRIVMLFVTGNYVLVLASGIAITVVSNGLFSLWITGKYRAVTQVKTSLSKGERKNIFKGVGVLMCHKIGTVVVASTDNIVISKFVSLAAVGIYSNYGTLVSAITKVAASMMNGMLPSVANFTATASKENAYKMLKRILFVDMWIASWTTICLFTLLNPFITVWLDESYLMSYAVVAVVCLQHYLQTARLPANFFVYGSGLFMKDMFRPLAEAIINLVVSVVLAKY